MRRRSGPLLLVLLAVLAACTPDKGFGAREISREDYGDRWPLTADVAVIACEPGGVPTLTVDGTTYGLATVDARGIRPAIRPERILADDPGGGRKAPTVLLHDALALCA